MTGPIRFDLRLAGRVRHEVIGKAGLRYPTRNKTFLLYRQFAQMTRKAFLDALRMGRNEQQIHASIANCLSVCSSLLLLLFLSMCWGSLKKDGKRKTAYGSEGGAKLHSQLESHIHNVSRKEVRKLQMTLVQIHLDQRTERFPACQRLPYTGTHKNNCSLRRRIIVSCRRCFH